MHLGKSDSGVRESESGVRGSDVRESDAGVRGQTMTVRKVQNPGGLAVIQDAIISVHHPELQTRVCA